MKTKLVKPVSKILRKRIDRMASSAISDQKNILRNLLRKAQHTKFGKQHRFDQIKSYTEYKRSVPLNKYENFIPYVEEIIQGSSNILWPGRPLYFAKTSGTIAGIKYIPISKDSLPNHINTASNALFSYLASDNSSNVLDGKLLFLSGSPDLMLTGGIPAGRLSGIVNHEIPFWLRRNQVPSYNTNSIIDWETKLDGIVKETIHTDLRMISGIPPWVKMYYERILECTGKKYIIDQFPNLQLFIYGGVNFEPYRSSLENLVGKCIPSIETYPTSEGFIAFQNSQSDPSLLLNTNSGIFFEFVELKELDNASPTRLALEEVKKETDYAIVLSTNAGLWAYILGDLIRFTSLQPFKIVVKGRIGQYTSAFGEHVIAYEAETSICKACIKMDARLEEFLLAPQVTPPEGGKPYHEWFIDFAKAPENMDQFRDQLDLNMQQMNPYYADLIHGNILQPLKIRLLKNHGLRDLLRSQEKLGGQNKVPRLSNNRNIADKLYNYLK